MQNCWLYYRRDLIFQVYVVLLSGGFVIKRVISYFPYDYRACNVSFVGMLTNMKCMRWFFVKQVGRLVGLLISRTLRG